MKKRMSFWVICMMIFFVSLSGKAIHAASASIAFSTSNKNPVEGDSFIVTMTVESGVGISDFQTYVAYDPSVLQLVGTGEHVSGNDGLVLIRDVGNEKDQLRQYSMKFKAVKEGTSEIYVSDQVYIYEASTGEEMSVSKNTIQINVGKNVKKTASSNQGLSSLSISEGNLVPEFESSTLEYNTKVSANTKMLYVNAVPKLSAYKVKVEGNENLKTGNNKVYIRVEDTNGKEKVYTINVFRAEKESEEKQSKDTKFSLQTKEKKTYFNTSMKLELVSVPDTVSIPEGFVKDSIKIQGKEITVYMPKEDNVSDFVLVYGKTKEGKAGFYSFDRIEQTLQRYKNIKSEEKDISETTENVQTNGWKKAVFVLVVMVIFLLWMLIRVKKKERARRNRLTLDWEEEDENERWK